MKTYSRKNSSYLKKAFIASNFNEMCRLCLSEMDLGLTPIFQEFSKISYQEWIQYTVDVLIEEGDGLPSNICEECLALVEQTYLFKKKCQASDSKLREHLELVDVYKEGKLNELGLIDFSEDHKNLFHREEQRESKCDESSAVDSGGTGNQKSDKEESEKQQSLEEPAEEEPVEEKPAEEEPVEDQPLKVVGEEEGGGGKTKNTLHAEEPVKETPTQVFYSDVEFEHNEPLEKVVKRYILKGEKRAEDQEEDLTVCEVVPLDVKNDEISNVDETGTCTTLLCPSQNGHENEFDKPQETKIQEIYQLWDNEEEVDEEQEGEKAQQEILIMSWDDHTDKNDKTQNTEPLEVDVGQNGVIELHKVFTNKNRPQIPVNKGDKKIITTTQPVSFKCFACGKTFSKWIELKVHLYKFHQEVSDAAFCEICGKSFVCTNNLKRHMAIHTGYKPHMCKICGRTFTQGSILKRHVFTHETLKPFNCQICGKGYTQKMNLLAHFKNHGFRTEGESFNCQYCNKTFMHQSGLSRHIKLHKGVRFSCEHCDKTFGDCSALSRHVKTIHSK